MHLLCYLGSPFSRIGLEKVVDSKELDIRRRLSGRVDTCPNCWSGTRTVVYNGPRRLHERVPCSYRGKSSTMYKHNLPVFVLNTTTRRSIPPPSSFWSHSNGRLLIMEDCHKSIGFVVEIWVWLREVRPVPSCSTTLRSVAAPVRRWRVPRME